MEQSNLDCLLRAVLYCTIQLSLPPNSPPYISLHSIIDRHKADTNMIPALESFTLNHTTAVVVEALMA